MKLHYECPNNGCIHEAEVTINVVAPDTWTERPLKCPICEGKIEPSRVG